ncbi:hypothetical protein F4811DRAFT_538526 [Daldinia bambusicola]|nr:hypothetical protein F4811DRAFT_538526 [Daldinia bambusicola]
MYLGTLAMISRFISCVTCALLQGKFYQPTSLGNEFFQFGTDPRIFGVVSKNVKRHQSSDISQLMDLHIMHSYNLCKRPAAT